MRRAVLAFVVVAIVLATAQPAGAVELRYDTALSDSDPGSLRSNAPAFPRSGSTSFGSARPRR